MTFDIEWKPKSLKFLYKLPKDISLIIWKKIEEIKNNPFRYLEHLEGDELYKLRIGDYRALISIDLEIKLLTIEVLDKRGRIYKRN